MASYTLYYPSEQGYFWYSHYYARWEITCTPNEQNNTTAVSAQFQEYRDTAAQYYHDYQTTLTVGSTTKTYRVYTGSAIRCAGGSLNTWNSFGDPVTTTVTHDSDGIGTLVWKMECPADTEIASYGAFGLRFHNETSSTRAVKIVADTVDTTIDLQKLECASTINTIPSAVYTSESLTLTMSRKNSAYCHKASFYYGDILLAASDVFETTLTQDIPDTWFTNCTDSAIMAVTVSVQTYSDSSCAEVRGSPATATVTVTASEDMTPTITDLVLSASDSVSCTAAFVKGYSKVKADITANADSCQGASIAKYQITVQGTTTELESEDTGVVLISSNTVSSAGTLSVTAVAVDSRGRTGIMATTITVLDYAMPAISGASIFRCTESGEADEDGQYISLTATATVYPLGGTNIGTLIADIAGNQYTLESATTTIAGIYSPDTTYTPKITLTDSVGNSVSYITKLPTRVWALNFAEKGDGAAFGMACEQTQGLAIPAAWDYYKGTSKLSAADVGARADTWLPSETEVVSDIETIRSNVSDLMESESGNYTFTSAYTTYLQYGAVSYTRRGFVVSLSFTIRPLKSGTALDTSWRTVGTIPTETVRPTSDVSGTVITVSGAVMLIRVRPSGEIQLQTSGSTSYAFYMGLLTYVM